MRQDHASLGRQNQTRQSDLEKQNTELMQSVTEAQAELRRVKLESVAGHGQREGQSDSSNYKMDRDYVLLQQKVSDLKTKVEEAQDMIDEKDRIIRHLDSEKRAALMSFEQEGVRAETTLASLTSQIATLEGQLRDATGRRDTMRIEKTS